MKPPAMPRQSDVGDRREPMPPASRRPYRTPRCESLGRWQDVTTATYSASITPYSALDALNPFRNA